MPPSATVGLVVAILAILALVTVVTIVEVPLRVRAVGVLMPPGGFVDVVAVEAGQVSRVHAADGQQVAAGEILVEISATGTNLPAESLPGLNLRSLQTELALVNQAHAKRQDIATAGLLAIQEERDAAMQRSRIGNRQLESHRAQLAVLQSRIVRLRELADEGHVSRDSLDRENIALLRASAEGTDLEQQALELELAITRLSRSEREAERQVDLDKTAHRIESERLLREITRAEYRLAQSITAPADSIVARVLVRPGVSIRKGQVIAKLYRPGQRLEAWLYVSSSSARMLQTGQSVQIRLDAYPKEVFGTQTAVVSHVSGVALVPEEVFVPLTLGGPVFEIRANLRDTHLDAYGSEWPLAPGTAFKADILQRQFKLYEWLMRSFLVDADGGNA